MSHFVRRHGVATMAVVWLVCCAVPQSLAAQTAVRDSRLRYSIVGSLVGAALAGGYYVASDRGERAGQCDPKGCALPYLAVSGAITGLFLARDIDAQRRADRPRAGTLERLPVFLSALPSMPLSMATRDSMVAVLSDSGVSLYAAVRPPRALQRRATGLSGLRMVEFAPGNEALLIGGQSALYAVGIMAGPARRTLSGEITALAVSDSGWLAARGRTLVVEYRQGGVLTRDSLDVGESVGAAVYDAPTASWMIGTDSALIRVAVRNGALVQTGRWPSTGPIRAIAAKAQWIATAEGNAGVTVWQRDLMTAGVLAPQRVPDGPQFAYDLTFSDAELFVAGGTDGLFRIALDAAAQVRSVSKELPFVTLVRMGTDGVLWAGDRARAAVVRVETTMPPR